jgi:hypothetical protein
VLITVVLTMVLSISSGKDDLIGRTTVDLEDRWFDNRWQEWGYENMITPGQDLTDPSKVRWKTKPIECRTLYAPGFTLGRGNLECWVDLMTPEEAITFPPDDVSLPPKQVRFDSPSLLVCLIFSCDVTCDRFLKFAW